MTARPTNTVTITDPGNTTYQMGVRKPPAEAIAQLERVVLEGNLATLKEGERVAYYARVCESLGLNPLTKPFEYITLNSKLVMYVTKSGTDQLRDIHGVSIVQLDRDRDDEHGLFTVIASAVDRSGRVDSGMGVVSIAGKKGEDLANAMMKAETKAKRRATLSIVGLGWMDEVEAFDRRAIEVAPRAALADAVASRTAALTSGSSEAPAEGVSTGEGAPSPSPASVIDAPNCDHPNDRREARADGLYCDRCGRKIAGYDGEVVDEPKPAPRGRKTAAKAKSPGDDGYGTARAHAVAAERGLDHDAVHRIAADVVNASSTTPVDDNFSVKNLDDATWAQVIAAISDAPITKSVKEAERYAGSMALDAGYGEGDDPWPEADPMLADMFPGVAEYGVVQFIEFGIRVAARSDA